ncbi:hypothetical protein [Alicyclobacillus macrosporangiidus]|uniref:hypothetical protein n=1 Tax=Alicyclobacillus macrosporangiidus TaxID=392015 RepID=UPI000AF32E8F|nr:hypothetical protein [Alicyclobacillus macrosporangiidus]
MAVWNSAGLRNVIAAWLERAMGDEGACQHLGSGGCERIVLMRPPARVASNRFVFP